MAWGALPSHSPPMMKVEVHLWLVIIQLLLVAKCLWRDGELDPSPVWDWTRGLHGEGSIPAFGGLKSSLVGWEGGGAHGQTLPSPPAPHPQTSEHNVSHEAVAIKRMLELGLVKNLTYF